MSGFRRAGNGFEWVRRHSHGGGHGGKYRGGGYRDSGGDSGGGSSREPNSRGSQAHYYRRQNEGIPFISHHEYANLTQRAQAALERGTKAVDKWYDIDSPRIYEAAAKEWDEIRSRLKYRIQYDEYKTFHVQGMRWRLETKREIELKDVELRTRLRAYGHAPPGIQ
jgi:hypothetical protein